MDDLRTGFIVNRLNQSSARYYEVLTIHGSIACICEHNVLGVTAKSKMKREFWVKTAELINSWLTAHYERKNKDAEKIIKLK